MPAEHSGAALLVEVGALLLGLGLLGRVARAARVPSVPLYLLAGLAFGSGGLVDLTASQGFLRTAAEIGVILLLVLLGLEYSAEELVASLRTQAPMGVVDALLNAVPGALLGWALGWGAGGAVALAGVTWVSSSGVVAKSLLDLGRLANRETPAVLGLLVVEDLSMALYLPLLTALLAHQTSAGTLVAICAGVATLTVVLVVALRFGTSVSRLVGARDTEPLLLGVLGLTLLVSGAAQQLRVSAAVGAFLVGIALSGPVAIAATQVLSPLRDLFAAVFFVFFGLSTDPGELPAVLPLAIALAVLTSATKTATGWLAARRAGIGPRGRWRAGLALIPRAEFSVVIASLAVAAGVDRRLGPLTAGYVLTTVAVGALATRLHDAGVARGAARSRMTT